MVAPNFLRSLLPVTVGVLPVVLLLSTLCDHVDAEMIYGDHHHSPAKELGEPGHEEIGLWFESCQYSMQRTTKNAGSVDLFTMFLFHLEWRTVLWESQRAIAALAASKEVPANFPQKPFSKSYNSLRL